MTRFAGLLVVTILGGIAASSGAQTRSDDVEWDVTLPQLSVADKQNIAAVTQKLGYRPRRVVPWHPSVVVSPGCEPVVVVETPIAVNGPRRSSKTILLLKLDKEGQRRCQARSKAVTVGQWVGFRDLVYDDIKWRIDGEGLTLDVILGPNVAYEDARRIVLAIHRGAWTRRPPLERYAPWSDPDSSKIQSITRNAQGVLDYKIGFSPVRDTEESWTVRLTDSRVEVVSYQIVTF
jgi:hypothetical protein